MTTQDPELSAALGWPGGISDPVLDRVQLLRMVAALMQDKLWEDHRVRHLWDHAQQAEPVQVAERERVASQWDGCVTHQLDTFGPVDIGASIRAGELVEAQQDSACLHGVEDGACKECYATETDLSRCPQCNGPADNGFDRSFPPSPYLCTKCMAEPVEPVAWMVYTLDGKSVCVTDNPADFGEGHRALPLYTAPPQRKLVSLTEDEIYHATGHFGVSEHTAIKIARAVEKASWEKNHGQA